MADETLARLMTFGNVLITSHQGYCSHDAVGQIVGTTDRNIADHLTGRANDNLLVPPGAGGGGEPGQ
ncbi:hypothetical protein [Streptosporangium nondiastaticum]|uniref:hypothetical protein n=1 Tax=Streptosporangium nondiastaticum TaxID=35764 RepID=UPI00167AAB09|nr:hypothetical protein [Streptosporangium nondiastaticum]